jgi:hypothetical protein
MSVHSKLTAEVAPTITWDPDSTDTAAYDGEAVAAPPNVNQPSTPSTFIAANTRQPPSAMTAGMPTTNGSGHGGVTDGPLQPPTVSPAQTADSHTSATPTNASPVRSNALHNMTRGDGKAQYSETHGTVSTRTERGEWAESHCSRSECTLGWNHDGPCSDVMVPIVQGPVAASTRSARNREQPETIVEEDESDREGETHEDEAAVDALLASSNLVAVPQFLEDDFPGLVVLDDENDLSALSCLRYNTCIDAYSATVDLNEIQLPSTIQKPTKKGEFDMSLPMPTDIASAMKSKNWDVENGYKYAVDRECSAWIKQKVLRGTSWDQIHQDLHTLNMRCLFSVKTDKKNRFQRAKLRIILLGHQHAVKQGEHYFENFSQTARWSSIRALCAQACINGFTIAKQVDTGAAFLFEDVEESSQVLVKVPKELGEILGCGELAFCVKAAYGLPSAPRSFFKFVKRVCTDPKGCGLTQSRQDEAVFYCIEGNDYIFVGTWVDDFLVLSNSQRLYDRWYTHYKQAVDDALEESNLEFMLGVNFDVDFALQTIKIYSEKAIDKMVQKFGTPSRASHIPGLEDAYELTQMELPEVGSPEHSALRDRAARYRSLVPSILYTVTTTRADAAYMTGILCRTLDNPTSKHCDAAEMLLSYLVTTKTMGICYGGDHIERQLKTVYSPLKDGLTALSDSNWTAEKSISAYLIYLAGGLIMWASKRQPVTSLSSTEAEYYAASACGAEVLAIRYFLSEITGNAHPLATPVYVDNSGCVNLAKDFNSCKRTKHIDRRIHFLTDYQDMGEIQVIYIPTSRNTADALTKPLPKAKFLEHRSLIARESAAWGGVRVNDRGASVGASHSVKCGGPTVSSVGRA